MPAKKGSAPKPAAKQQAKPKAKAASKAKEPAKEASKQKSSSSKGSAGKGSTLFGVYVTKLNFPGMDNDAVRSIFNKYGKIAQLKIRKDTYVIVWYDKAENASKALELNGKDVKGCKKISVVPATAQPARDKSTFATTAMVGGLPGGVTAAQLSKHFAGCGKLVKCRVYSGNYGFLYFRTNAAVTAAIKLAKEQPLNGKTVTVRYSSRTQKGDRKKDNKQRLEACLLKKGREKKWTSVH
eukprot:TRINITY_DN25863_c0_g1_i1.p1 TRINITY_DN25863_c0_g1~~TRINITY_DN25863_c0_g1_i1.p1  ORF type:complete len:248 (-),score=60.54 TRINITY_DN25863_c0_g1_i1:53-769(-)